MTKRSDCKGFLRGKTQRSTVEPSVFAPRQCYADFLRRFGFLQVQGLWPHPMQTPAPVALASFRTQAMVVRAFEEIPMSKLA